MRIHHTLLLVVLGGMPGPLAAADRAKAWDNLGTQPAQEAVKTMAALANDADGTVALLAGKLRPVPAIEPAMVDRIFRALDDEDSAVRAKASDALHPEDFMLQLTSPPSSPSSHQKPARTCSHVSARATA